MARDKGLGRHMRAPDVRHRWSVVLVLGAGGLVTASLAVGALGAQAGSAREVPALASRSGARVARAAATAPARAAPSRTTVAPVPPPRAAAGPPPTVLSVGPAQPAGGLPLHTVVTVRLSHAPVSGAPMPWLSPAVDGKWAVHGSTLSFTPASSFAAWATERLVVPSRLAAAPSQLPVLHFAGVPLLRAQQLLAELGYIPLRFGPTPSTSALPAEPHLASEVRTVPQPGTFTWRYPNIPPSLEAAWVPGDNVITRGAIMRFEADHGLVVDWNFGPQVWNALVRAVAARQLAPTPYDYLMVSEALPERLVVWSNGRDVYQSLANTGVPGATTPPGTYPVYERFLSTTMQGTDVNGARYDVSGVPWVAYFYGGDAVHGYWRASYGYPQSNGCVALPVANARVVWSMDPLGTLVNVSA